ncbi:hypothetical protein L596_002686 [Steinernema carpocapsae]|uniref:LUC7-like protein n=1 Tax=Steinernema carpocapsae TaxID=34508 RepID=A0A4U8UQG2_STECR|nr:hypothetical protein L596_002686 [Steinernema carpocapsae]
MTDMMRDMINQLMGVQRAEEEGRNLVPYHHHSVCRAYLLDCCPYETLVDTRLEAYLMCRKLHESAHRGEFQKAQEKRDHFYDVEAFDVLEDAVRTVDTEVNKIKEKIKRDSEEQFDSAEFVKSQKVIDLNDKISSTLAKVEELGNDGKIEESLTLTKTVEELKKRKRELENEMRTNVPSQQRLRVCEACGAQLNILDHESRLADHYGGKMHLGMVEIREKYNKMKETIEERREARRKNESSERDRPRDRDRRRDYDNSRRDRRDRADRDDYRRDRDRDSERRGNRDRSRSPRRSSRDDRSRDNSVLHRNTVFCCSNPLGYKCESCLFPNAAISGNTVIDDSLKPNVGEHPLAKWVVSRTATCFVLLTNFVRIVLKTIKHNHI